MLEELSSSTGPSCSGQCREPATGNVSCHADVRKRPDKHSAKRRAMGRPPASQRLWGTAAGHERGAEPHLFRRRACWPQEGSHLRLQLQVRLKYCSLICIILSCESISGRSLVTIDSCDIAARG